MKLQEFTKCMVCGKKDVYEIASADQLSEERKLLQDLFQKQLHPDLPDYMYKDQINFTHTYAARLVGCKYCGAVYRDPCLTPEGTYLEYAHDVYHDEWLEASFEPYCQMFLADMPRLTKLVGAYAKALELGSQVGGFLYAAKHYGWDINGVDVGVKITAFSRSKGLDVFTGTLKEFQAPSNYYDAVFVWSCFEMLPDPWSDLKEIFRALRKGGKLFITIPNGEFIKFIQPFMQFRVASPFKTHIIKIMAYGILLGFSFQAGYTPSNMNFMLTKSGFEDIKVSNLFYLPVTSRTQASLAVIAERKRYMKIAYWLSQIISFLTLRKVILGPWIEIIASKPL